ncbi:MAG: peptidylprolyl isomerase [Candidatus Bilamarchaeum sp.]|jgi:peptidyl-prolyl cis-trans isomerase B (cyclophilin B)
MKKHDPVVVLETNKGIIEVELNPHKAPITVENFLKYVEMKHYDGTIFHRVIKGFMVQCGGFNTDKKEKRTGPPIKLESKNGLKNDKFTLAMARTEDPNSATAQFFINTKDNKFLNHSPGNDGYAVFGKIISGQEVVEEIENAKTGVFGFHEDWPKEDLVIIKAHLKK